MRPHVSARSTMMASKGSWAPFALFMALAGFGSLAAMPRPAHADTVRLRNGGTIEGKVLRSDASAVVVMVGSQPQFLAPSEVEAIHYSDLRFTPSTTSVSRVPSRDEPVRIDWTLLERIAARLRTSQGLMQRAGQIPEDLRHGRDREAAQEARLAVEGLLPTHHGRFNPLYALADLLILLGLRAPTAWLALLLVKEQRSFQRIAEFLVVAYGLTMLLMTLTLDVANLWITLFALPLALGSVAWLFAWMFALPFRRAVVAFVLTVGCNLAIEHLLTIVRLL